MKLVVGTRGSRLALIQTESVIAGIKQLHAQAEIDIVKIKTAGDNNQQTPLVRLGTSVFIKEIEEALLGKSIDIAVHSLKDVPTEIPSGLRLLAVTRREDPRDTLVAKSPLNKLPEGARIGTDSLRRAIQLKHCRPDLKITSLRGNIETRVKKVETGEIDGAVIAAAAMKRLGWEDKITEYLPLDNYLPAAGQGAIVIEGREADMETANLILSLNHPETWSSITAERTFLKELGGGCRAPIAAIGTVKGGLLNLRGMIGSIQSQQMISADEEGPADLAGEIGRRLAHKLLRMGAANYIAEVEDL
jgi:hydroxymethylbilane synthase